MTAPDGCLFCCKKVSKVKSRFLGIRRVFFSLFLIFLWQPAGVSYAETDALPRHEVIFVLDASNSMNTSDPAMLAPDAAAELLGALPSTYKAGFVAFNNGVQAAQPLGDPRDAAAAARQLVYTGYTDAGAGLAKAMRLFSGDAGVKRAIVLILDGEIMLPDAAATEASKAMFFKEMAAAKKRGIRVLTLALGGRAQAACGGIYDGEGQKVFEAFSAQGLAPLAQKLLYEEFGVQKLSVNTGGAASGGLTARLPLAHSAKLSQVKLLVSSDLPLAGAAASYSAVEGTIQIGKRYTLVSLQRPQCGEVALTFGAQGGSVKVDLIMEMQAKIKTEISAFSEKYDAGAEMAEIRLTPVDAANENLRLLDDPYFEGRSVRVLVSGKEQRALVKAGAIVFALPAEDTYDAEAQVRYEDLGINMAAPEKIYLRVVSSRPYALYAVLAAGCATAAWAFLHWRRKKPLSPVPAPPSSRYEYAGRLKVYLTQSPDDLDVAPMVYNLYRRFTGEAISLQAMMESCGLPYTLLGAEKLFFSPGAQKALVLTNKSDCTVLKNRDLLVKDHSCLVYFDERVYITFEDERSEMILEYKNVKPSEK